MKFNVGDLVVQKSDNPIIKIKGRQSIGKKSIGIILRVSKMDPMMWKHHPAWAEKIGCTVDVLWSNGKMQKNFAGVVLEVVSQATLLGFMNIFADKIFEEGTHTHHE